MDSLIAAAARALALGDDLGALKRVALRDDPPALALRGIALARLGEYARARELLKRAARGFEPEEVVARARAIVAEAEVALALRDLSGSPGPLALAAEVLQREGDLVNAEQARLVSARRLLLLGRLDEAAQQLDGVALPRVPPALLAVAELIRAEIGLRRLELDPARSALERARVAANRARLPALSAEVEEAGALFERPAARRLSRDGQRALQLGDVLRLLNSETLVVDACRRGIRAQGTWRSFGRRPVLFALARELAAAWPGDVDRETLMVRTLGARRPSASHRARLRVEMSRLRQLVRDVANVRATAHGFALERHTQGDVALLVPPIDDEWAPLLALLADGTAWSTSALSLVLGDSQRTIQRALVELEAEGKVRSVGRGRARRWLAPPLVGFTTILLLPALAPLP